MDDPGFCKALLTYRLINDDAFLLEPPCEQRHESASEFAAHGGNWKEKFTVLTTLEMMPNAMLIYPASRHNAVNVRMVEQIGSPRMEDGSHPSEKPFIGSKSIDGSPRGLEHTVVEDTLMSHRNRMQTRRYSKYSMEVLRRDNLFPAAVDPLLALLVLTLGAMAVPATVVTDMYIPALWAHLDMASQGTGPAKGHVTEGSFNRRYNMMLTKELPSMTADDLSDVETGPHRLGGKMVSIRRTCLIGSMSAT